MLEEGLTPSLSCAVRSAATEGNQPQGWRQLEQPVRPAVYANGVLHVLDR
jgi:hypothetical protein